jgi:hypothetical protein
LMWWLRLSEWIKIQCISVRDKWNLAPINLGPWNPSWEFLSLITEYTNSVEFRPLRESDPIEDH